MNLKRTLGPLSEPTFARYFAAVVITQAGTYASAIALSFAVLAASNPTSLGLIFVAREIPVLVLLLAGGVLGDRLPRRFVLAGASFVAGKCSSRTCSTHDRHRRGRFGFLVNYFDWGWIRFGV